MCLLDNSKGRNKRMPVITISQDEYVRIKVIVMDENRDEALYFLKDLIKRIESEEKRVDIKP